MYLDKQFNGDDSSVAEELLAGVPELEQKGNAVIQAVNEGYFNLEQALSVYKISEIEYLIYRFLKEYNGMETETKEAQMIWMLSQVEETFHMASFQFNSTGKMIIEILAGITKDPAVTKIYKVKQ